MLEKFFFGRHLEDDENVTAIVHKHWLVGIKEIIIPSASFVLALGLVVLRQSTLAVAVAALWGTCSLVWWMRNFLDYYLDVWVITDRGIIDLEWLGWFHRQSSRILYSDIQGVSTEVSGIAATLLRYGTVSVEKISTGSKISLPFCPRPRSVESLILKNMESYLHDKNLKNAKHIQELLSDFVAQSVQEDGFGTKQKPPAASEANRIPLTRPTKTSFRSSRIGSGKR